VWQERNKTKQRRGADEAHEPKVQRQSRNVIEQMERVGIKAEQGRVMHKGAKAKVIN
jgi:hypothetical protein